MSELTAYSDLYAFMVVELPGAENRDILAALQRIGREFCVLTEAWKEDLFPIAVTDYQQDYALAHDYDANIHRLRELKVNGQVYGTDSYDLYQEDTLRFDSGSVPHDLDNQLLICATAGITTIAAWQAVTDGSVTFSIGGSTYLVEDLDFSGCADIEAVALALQTGLRDKMSSNTGLVRWRGESTNKFHVWVESGVCSYLTAGTAGTDISGSGYMNGLTGSATLAGLIETEVSFRPHKAQMDFPGWFLDRWSETIMAGAIALLAGQNNMPWHNAEKEQKFKAAYAAGRAEAKAEKERDKKKRALDFSL